MVVDLVSDKGGRTYYTNPWQLPDGGVTNKKYKTDYLVMRLIPAKDAIFPMGLRWTNNEAVYYHRAKLTNDFYMAVYELTLGQFRNMTGEAAVISYYTSLFPDGGYGDNMANPVGMTKYASFRGTSNVWPTNGHDIDSSCYLQKCRDATGIDSLDLPTEAEWEFACRAGMAKDRYDGVNVTSGNDPLPTSIAWLRQTTTMYYRWSEEWGLPHEVGLLLPNAFGLYDTLGNVGEVCLDLYNVGANYCTRNDDVNGEPVVAPIGRDTDVKGDAANASTARHVMRGGTCVNGIWAIVAYTRQSQKADQSYPCNENLEDHNQGPFGYRLVCLP
jgi:formylglycine-generating enzyme required for sulfatase activity